MSLSELIAASPIAALICDPLEPDTPIIECNAAFVALTGYSREEVLGRNCRFMRGSGTERSSKITLMEDGSRIVGRSWWTSSITRRMGPPFATPC